VLGVSQDTGVTMPDTNIVTQNDLLIVGPGVLGRLVAAKWLKVCIAVFDASTLKTSFQHQPNIILPVKNERHYSISYVYVYLLGCFCKATLST
jgi:hypothetical protein